MNNKCPFHHSIPDLIKKIGSDDIQQYITNLDKVSFGNQLSLYKIPFVGSKLGDIYGEISGSTIRVITNQDAHDALNYIRNDVHDRKKTGTDQAVCPFENAFFSSNGYGYKVYTITQENLRQVLEQSVKDYNGFTQAINNTKNSLLCVILEGDGNNLEILAQLERELILMKNDVYTKQGYMGGFVASQTLAGAARVSHVGSEQDVQVLEKGPFKKEGKPMVMTRQAHYGSRALTTKNLFDIEQATYSEKMAINFGDYGSYRNPIQILNGINFHIQKENLSTLEINYLCQNLHKLYNDFFFEGQQGDNGEFLGKIAYDKNKLKTYRTENEQSTDMVINYFYEQYICLMSKENQKIIYQVLTNKFSDGLDLIEGLLEKYKDQYKNLITLLDKFVSNQDEGNMFSKKATDCLIGFQNITLGKN